MIDALTDLLDESRELGFLGPGPVIDHLRRAKAFAAAAPRTPARALDLGAGGGLPGLVLAALVWPETRWCFLDGMVRRTSFLERAVRRLDLGDRVQVVTERAEETGRRPEHRGAYDLVVARSFAAPGVAAECAAPLLQVGGTLLVSEPPDTPMAARWPTAGVAGFGFGPAVAVEIADEVDEGDDEPTHFVRLLLESPVDDRYPRRVGIPAKRPLF
ncbi:hypothetical protein BH10ACT1_BH10ACT1_40450 [soil metagenome]